VRLGALGIASAQKSQLSTGCRAQLLSGAKS
jgi:hypothetical protein